MNLLNFMTYFPDEESCKRKWKEIHEQDVTCLKCGSTAHLGKLVAEHRPQVIPN